MIGRLLSALGQHKETAVLVLLGLLVGPYFLKQAIGAFMPLMIESRVIQNDLKQEILSAEARSKQYVDLKNDTLLEAISGLKKGVDQINYKMDRIYQYDAVSGTISRKQKNKN